MTQIKRSSWHWSPKELVGGLLSLMEKKIWLKILVGLVLGLAVGFGITQLRGSVDPGILNTIVNWVGFPGKIFLTLIQMIVIPLVFVSVVRGITASRDTSQLKAMGVRVALYFLMTTTVAVCLGFLVAGIIKPGNEIRMKSVRTAPTAVVQTAPSSSVETETKANGTIRLDTIPKMLVDLLPANPMVAMSKGEMLQVVLFAIIIGMAILTIPVSQSEVFLSLMASIQEICMAVVKWAMIIAPFAVFGLMAEAVAKSGIDAILGLSGYVGSVVLGLICVLIFYLLLVYFVGKRNPFEFLSEIRPVQLLAFSTSSSAAVMPLTMETAEDKLKLNPTVSRFVIPLGTTINMDGTALYQAVATYFLATAAGIDLDLGAIVLVTITAIGASIGSPGTPGVGIVILSGLLANLGVPATGIALIVGVDRILDMCRTVINVTGDLTAAVVLDRFHKA